MMEDLTDSDFDSEPSDNESKLTDATICLVRSLLGSWPSTASSSKAGRRVRPK